MESPERKKQKVLKAKKTMPASCRKQLEILNVSKNVEASKSTVGTNIPNGNHSLCPELIASNCPHSENADSSFAPQDNSVFSQKKYSILLEFNTIEEIVSEIRSRTTDEQVVCFYTKPRHLLIPPANVPHKRQQSCRTLLKLILNRSLMCQDHFLNIKRITTTLY